ncbi:colicin transporter [Morganella morganii]|uniref:Colicin transporter n=1 Tax=Morganella morganii TaxID=582 RepID=A0A8I0Q4J1_MORMO|nr:colicin E1 family microcin immunity protein [Morganella morganii]MBE8614795.1 colicin transporter [Morganella morganii]
MNKKYYIKNMCWGWFIGILFLYSCMESEHKYKYIILFISVVGIGLYPLAKWCVEWFFLKFTTREFWNSGFFMETPGKAGLLAIYYGSVFLLSIPITVIFSVIIFIKRLLKK